MAFDINTFVEKNSVKNKSSNGFDVDSFVKKQTDSITNSSSGFNVEKFTAKYGGNPSSKSLKTSQGLYNLASQSGLKDRADSILKEQSGEKTKEIFSGGFISDVFDVLSSFQYGTVGLLKGKSFSEGVKTRQSFTDKDALGDKGLPGVIAGIALDIAFDPLTYIAPATIVKKIPFATKLLKGAKEAAFGKKVVNTIEGTDKTFEAVEGGTKLGKYLASKLVYMQGADPVFRETYERSIKNIAVETQNIVDMAKGVSKLTPQTAAKILKRDETGRFARNPIAELDLKPDEIESVVKLYQKIDNLGKEAVDLGLLSKEKYEENIGEYIKNAYSEYEQSNVKSIFGKAKVGIKGIKSRVEGLTPEKMKELGQIDNPAYLLFKSAVDLTRDVENAKLFKAVDTRFGSNVAQEGFTRLPTGQRLGSLAGKYVPENVATYLQDIIEPAKNTIAKQLVANFKFAKVVMNPATHARNIMSNKILNYWKLGMNPLDPRVIKSDLTALKEIAKGTGKFTEEARPLGYNLDTFASAEMKGLLDSPEAMSLGKQAGGLWNTTKKKLGDLYQSEENQAKLSAYIFNRTTKNLSPEDAWKAAESATFNYAQVTPFVRKLRESLFGLPFITFTVKSTPLVAETIAKNPNRISALGKIKQGIENLSDIKETEREKASEPAWIKNGFYVKLPIKDKEGRSAYFDLTYILPFGDLISGNFFERGENLETGLQESIPRGALRKSPFANLVGEMYQNKDFYGNKIWKESDPVEKQLGDLTRHLTKFIAPPLVADQLPGGYNSKGERQQKGFVGAMKENENPDQQRTVMQELLRTVGAKIQPIDADIQETYQEWNKKKALESLLRENGVMEQFTQSYVPRK